MSTKHKFVTYGSGPNGVQWRWVNYYTTAADFTPTEAQMQAWITAMWATVSTEINSLWTIYAIGYAPWIGTGLDTDRKGWGATVVYNVSLSGSNGTDSLPAQSAGVVLGRTATKRVIGKKFVPGIGENCQAAGVFTAPTKTCLANLGGLMYASTYMMGATSLTPQVWGTHHGFTQTISTSVSPYAGTQRRRKPGVGI